MNKKRTRVEKISKELAMEKIEELEENIKELRGIIEQEEDLVYVPDDILIEGNAGYGDELGIVFNEGKQKLTYDDEGVYSVYPSVKDDFVKCKLIKVDKPMEGNIYYFSDYELQDIDDQEHYCKYLGDGRYAYVDYNTDITINDSTRENRYQVVPV